MSLLPNTCITHPYHDPSMDSQIGLHWFSCFRPELYYSLKAVQVIYIACVTVGIDRSNQWPNASKCQRPFSISLLPYWSSCCRCWNHWKKRLSWSYIYIYMLPTAFRPRLHWSQSMHLILEILLPSCNAAIPIRCSIALALTLQFWSIHPREGELGLHANFASFCRSLGAFQTAYSILVFIDYCTISFDKPPHWIRYGWTWSLDIRGYDWMTLAYFRPEMHVLVAMYDLVPRIAILSGGIRIIDILLARN